MKNSRKDGGGGLLPEGLVSRAMLDLLRKRIAHEGIDPTSNEPEPDWNQLGMSLQKEHDLNEPQSDELTRALERLWLLPFRRYEACASQVIFFYAQLPAIMKKCAVAKDPDGLLLINAFSLLVKLMLQGISLFPGEPHYIGQQLMNAIMSPAPGARLSVLPIARLLVDSAGGQWGTNHCLSENPNEIAIHEHFARRGRNEDIVASQHKYQSYCCELEETPLFWQEWEELKAAFKGLSFWDKYGIVRRSPIPDGNWRRDPLPDFKKPRDSFQATFDIFCCKWFLYGMQRATPRDEPLVQKLFYSLGPSGTAIFIPGYWSLDANRDLNWKAIQKLHRARGVRRQGEKLDINRRESALQAKRAQAANVAAKKLGLRGEARYRFIKQKAVMDERTDDAQVRRLLKKIL